MAGSERAPKQRLPAQHTDERRQGTAAFTAAPDSRVARAVAAADASPRSARQARTAATIHSGTAAALQQKKVTTPGGAASTVMQRVPWANESAKFRTDNEMANIPNSEYIVEAARYKRYAPVNEVRAPGQVFHEGPRSFAYLTGSSDQDVASKAATAKVSADDPNKVVLSTGKGASTTATRVPANGLSVWDADVTDAGKVGERHVGHAVEDLGQALPTLDNPDAVEKARTKQENVRTAQDIGLLKSDADFFKLMINLSDNRFKGDDEAALEFMKNDPAIGGAVEEAGTGELLNTFLSRRPRRNAISRP